MLELLNIVSIIVYSVDGLKLKHASTGF